MNETKQIKIKASVGTLNVATLGMMTDDNCPVAAIIKERIKRQLIQIAESLPDDLPVSLYDADADVNQNGIECSLNQIQWVGRAFFGEKA